ncbi:hypothetical protein D3C80_2184380 [compost metagenome]
MKSVEDDIGLLDCIFASQHGGVVAKHVLIALCPVFGLKAESMPTVSATHGHEESFIKSTF